MIYISTESKRGIERREEMLLKYIKSREIRIDFLYFFLSECRFFEVITSSGKERIFRFSDSIDATIVLKGRKV